MKLLACLLITWLGISLAFAQDDVARVKATLSKSGSKAHIDFLASDELKGRATGSAELDIAAKYLATCLERYGVKPVPGAQRGYFQRVPLVRTSGPRSLQLTINGQPFTSLVMVRGGNTDFKGSAVFVHYGDAKDYQGRQVAGKLVVALAGSEGKAAMVTPRSVRETKIQLARQQGAVGLLELTQLDDQAWRNAQHSYAEGTMTLQSSSAESPFPYLWLQDAKGELAGQLSTTKEVPASLAIAGITTAGVVSQNVVGLLEGTDPVLKKEYVMYVAHYDHVGVGTPDARQDSIYNGARDNAVGTVAVLSMAENLAKYPPKRSALFILFTAEEAGLLGSQWYAEHPRLPLPQMVYCLNSDNGGYNDTSLVTVVGLSRTTAETPIKEAARAVGLTAVDDPVPEQNLFDRSDNVHFAAKGIPAPTFGMGFKAFDQEMMQYYHRPADNPDTLDYDYLYKFFQAYVLAGRKLANAPRTPTWKEGDKYQAASRQLYGMTKGK